MFPSRYFPDRMFAPRYWPKVGSGESVAPSADVIVRAREDAGIVSARPDIGVIQAQQDDL